MKYTITAIKKTPITFTKRDGSAGLFTKVEVKTDKTGDAVYELGLGHSTYFKENIKVGDVVTGYTEAVPWSKNGKSGVNNKLNGLTVEYVYNLLLKIAPGLDNSVAVMQTPAAEQVNVPVEEGISAEEIGW